MSENGRKNQTGWQMELFYPGDDTTPSSRVVINDPENHTWVNKKQAEVYAEKMRNESERVQDTRGRYVMGKHNSIKTLEISDFSISDRRHFMQLVLYAQFNGEPLAKDGEALNNEMIAQIWGVARENASRRLRKFVQFKLLEKIRVGKQNHYVLNETYFQMGKYSGSEKFVKIFQNKLADVIAKVEKIQNDYNNHPKTTKKVDIIDVVGLLHAVIPYFHYQTYYLVSNSDEDIKKDGESILDVFKRERKEAKTSVLKHLKKAQIGRILGHKNVNNATIDKYMDYLQQAGAVMILKTNNKTRYLIHPDLMFRLNTNGLDDYTEFVRGLFGEHD
ncbi:hypothetical protein NLX67_19495 [Domibacillus sp. A3M-37]|uniref:hypothetical protein n=1 Tax=Domibacillus sp. A3M-37 TaxID=2962037 RepID=UPI0020B76541|nr:hypothetical protein [Domibacillus sp. A3M-37]MCP3764531.1 hypothetical protein [Domibacillus sp. A3M-37]